MLKNLPEGVEIVDVEAFARIAEAAQQAGRQIDIDPKLLAKLKEEKEKLRKAYEQKVNEGKEKERQQKELKDEKKTKDKKEGGQHDEL
ncbi:hypothetical protein TWF730_002256 [Orbilia blumenaviensis]|uniref:Uncharacterized protein n=1 Tax=Orbilia blumenaviensis TaxID=1796055 RepID=A0AAV9UD88_9PEZI